MPNLELFSKQNGTWVVWNDSEYANFEVIFQNEQQAMQFITDFMFKFYTDRVN